MNWTSINHSKSFLSICFFSRKELKNKIRREIRLGPPSMGPVSTLVTCANHGWGWDHKVLLWTEGRQILICSDDINRLLKLLLVLTAMHALIKLLGFVVLKRMIIIIIVYIMLIFFFLTYPTSKVRTLDSSLHTISMLIFWKPCSFTYNLSNFFLFT